jgi:hypothetical protein
LKGGCNLVSSAVLRAFLFLFLIACSASASAAVSVEIDLQEQRAYLLRNRRVVLETPISSGRAGYHSTTGKFKITQKNIDHRSSLYGKIVDSNGRTVVADADSDMPVPAGCRFVNAPMHYFMRYNGGEGMHAGYLPGYPASHGCVRLPKDKAIAFFNAVEIGTPVTVFGRTPNKRRAEPEEEWQDDRSYREYRRPFYEPRRRSWWPFGR